MGVLVGRIHRGVDVRDYGSGKTGFTNTLRSLGWGAALIVGVSDIMKGVIPVLIGRFVFDDPWAVALGGVAAVAGHMFPLFAGFRGGRGAATAFGAFAAIAPIAGLVLIVCAVIALAATRYASLTTVTATAAGCLAIVVLVAADGCPALPVVRPHGDRLDRAQPYPQHSPPARRRGAKLGQGGSPVRAVPEREAVPAPIRRAAVVGATGWGVTIAILLARNDVPVTLLTRSDEEAGRLRTDGELHRLPGVTFPPGLAISSDPTTLEAARSDLLRRAIADDGGERRRSRGVRAAVRAAALLLEGHRERERPTHDGGAGLATARPAARRPVRAEPLARGRRRAPGRDRDRFRRPLARGDSRRLPQRVLPRLHQPRCRRG